MKRNLALKDQRPFETFNRPRRPIRSGLGQHLDWREEVLYRRRETGGDLRTPGFPVRARGEGRRGQHQNY